MYIKKPFKQFNVQHVWYLHKIQKSRVRTHILWQVSEKLKYAFLFICSFVLLINYVRFLSMFSILCRKYITFNQQFWHQPQIYNIEEKQFEEILVIDIFTFAYTVVNFVYFYNYQLFYNNSWFALHLVTKDINMNDTSKVVCRNFVCVCASRACGMGQNISTRPIAINYIYLRN